MSTEENYKKFQLLLPLSDAVEQMRKLLEEIKKDAEDLSKEEFLAKGDLLFTSIKIYEQLLTRSGVANKKELECLWEKHYSDLDFQTKTNDLLLVEDEWNCFFERQDKLLFTHIENDLGTQDISSLNVMDAVTGSFTLKKFTELHAKIIILSFNPLEVVQQWMKETRCILDVFIDNDRLIYKAFGLKRSMYQVWQHSSVMYYAEQLAATRILPQPLPNFSDDIYQMGGNFIVNEEGNVIMAYRSLIPADRPTIESMLEIIGAYRDVH